MFKNPITVSTGDWFQKPPHTPKPIDVQIPYTKRPVRVNMMVPPYTWIWNLPMEGWLYIYWKKIGV